MQGNILADRPQLSMLGAVASSAGDDFHQLWGMRKVLALLKPNANVVEVKLEGLPIDEIHQELGTDGQIVDVTTEVVTDSCERRFHYEQLKYSPSHPETAWTWARLLADKSKRKKGTSIFVRLTKLLLETANGSTFSIVTNQPADERIKDDVKRLLLELKDDAQLDDELAKKLREATKCDDGELLRVLRAWDLSGFGSVSRLKLETEVIQRVSEFTDADARNDVDLLQQRIATLMLPEGMSHPPVTRETVLTWLGGGSSEILFPAPSRIQKAKPYLKRKRTDELVELIMESGLPIRLTAPGGCGKTSLVAALQEELPQGSEVIGYDCYGGGLFMSSDDRRHLPERALVQVSNDIAARLDIPVMLRRETSGQIAAAFLRRLRLASEMIAQRHEEARLVVVFDAADNSIIAAQHFKEACFLQEVNNLSDIPDNICLIFSCRDARKASLGQDSKFREFALQAFDEEETKAFIALHHETWVPTIAETLYELTGGTPRRLAYAVEGLNKEQAKEAFARLMPKATGIDPLFEKRLNEAGNRIGSIEKIELAIGVLANLPRPLPAWVIAELSGLLEADIPDVATDLGGITERNGGWSFHDEDFEFFARERTKDVSEALLSKAADLLLVHKSDDAYAARAVGEILLRTERYTDLYDLVRVPVEASFHLRGIEVQLIQSRRLTLAMNCCKAAGDIGAACGLLLSAADEMKNDRLVKKLLLNNLSLSCKFAPEQTMEVVFSTASHRRYAGPMRIHLAAACALSQPLRAKEHFRWWSAALDDWFQQEERQRFSITSDQIAAEFVARRQLAGTENAVRSLLCWRPVSNGQRPLDRILQRMSLVEPEEFLEVLDYRNWPPIILTQLMAAAILGGASTTSEVLHKKLSTLAATSRCRWKQLSAVRAAEQPQFATAALTICENLKSEVACHPDILRVLELAFPKAEFIEQSDIHRVKRYADFYARAFAIREHITKLAITVEDYLPELKKVPKRKMRGSRQYHSDHRREKSKEEVWNEAVREATSQLNRLVAAARTNNDADAIKKSLTRGYNEFGYHSEAKAIIRFVTAWLVQAGISGESLEAPLAACLDILRDWQSGDPKNRIEICVALSRVPGAHSKVLELLTQIAAEVEVMAAAASDRSELMMSCAHAALPMDEELARDFFERGIRLTEKVDVEALSQLELAAVVAEAGIDGSRDERVELATNLADTASAADATLGVEDHFPWSALVKGVAAIDLPTGLGAISQWRDFGILNHYRSTTDLLSGSAADALLGEYRFALSILGGDGQIRLRHCFQDSERIPAAAIDRYCQDVLVTGDRSVVLDARWEEAIVEEENWTDRTKQLHKVAGKLLEWHSIPDDNSQRPENEYSSLVTEAQVSEALLTIVSNKERVDSYAVSALAKRIAAPNLRTLFLRKAAEIAGDEGWLGEMLDDHLQDWKSYPPIATWAREKLPAYIAASMAEHFEWNYRETTALDKLLKLTGLPLHDQALIIFEGIQSAKKELHAELIYSLAGLVAVRADATIRSGLLSKLLDRLTERLDQEPKFHIATSVAPEDIDLCMARLLYSAMADIDREVRWDASHATLELLRLGCSPVIAHLSSLLVQDTEDVFAYQEAPFYAFAAQEQLLTTFYRATVDKPDLIAAVRKPIWDIAISTPHLIVRELGKRILLTLSDSGHLALCEDERAQLERLNKSPFDPVPRPEPVFGRPSDSQRRKRKFEFDDTDTIPYWYSTPSHMLNLPFESFLDRIEGWINGNWGFVESDTHWIKEPRVERLRNQSGNSDHRHGTIPRIERLSRYLEWHGMMHAVGELITEVPLIETGEYEDTVTDWIEYQLPTLPPYWVSDLRTHPPLEPRFWGHDESRVPNIDDDGDKKVWSERIPDCVFDEEVGLTGDGKEIVIGSSFKLRQHDGWEDIQIRSGLVTTETADALGHALLTVRDHMDFIIPPADDHREIAKEGFLLRGWICKEDRELKADKFDSRRGAVSGVPFEPASKFVRDLNLEFHPDLNGWIMSGTSSPALYFSYWGGEEERSPGNGWRAKATDEMLRAMLQMNNMSMILSVEIARGLSGENNYKRQWRIYIVDPTGTIRKVERKKRSLGRYWVRKLGFDYSCDTLLRWKLHRLAELADARQTAEPGHQQSIEAHIEKLWQSLGEKEGWDEDWPE